jgi:hypothetical protein
MVRLIPELKSMVYLISASMLSFIWTMVLIILLMYCAAVFYTDTANKVANDMDDHEDAQAVRKYWGSVGVSMLSLFQAITGGDDWRNFVDVFHGNGSYLANTLIFCVYVAFAMLVMLNLVTGVFVEGAQRIVQQDKDAELLKTVCKIFGALDDDHSMSVSRQEFMSHLEEGHLDCYFAAVDLSKSEAHGLFTLLDADGSDSLSVEEFVRGCLRLRGPARSMDLAGLVHNVQEKFEQTIAMTEGLEEATMELIKIVKQKPP